MANLLSGVLHCGTHPAIWTRLNLSSLLSPVEGHNDGMTMRTYLLHLLLAAVGAVSVIFGADPVLAQESAWPRTIQHAAGELTLPAKPKRILSTTPSVTGILLAMQAPLLATAATTPSPLTDDKGFFIQWADVADQRAVEVLYPNLSFDIEAIIGWEPDLVIGSATGADSIVQYLPELQAQGIPTLVVNYSNQSWQELATQLGAATGLEREATESINRFDARIRKVAQAIQPPKEPVSIVGYDISGSFSIGKLHSPQGQLLAALGLTVSELPATLKSQVSRSSNADFISRENLPAAITGTHVFLLRATEHDVADFLADPLLANLTAVQKKQVYPLGPTSFRIDYYSGLEMADVVAHSLGTQ
ncbi:Fe2+-enterobactin ABC transporter substrate-binding protein [Rhizobium sp. FY34]|uniref:Fe2+-enterobactin ABC transporter substrate-binding protein n=1 Tax=Rhizobium sp. FY34 TaxID=2562309 RepID=UPI001FEFDF7F|nr:Fe2+-enterobactin ABC transporter substrate-binding protein [Rhizobium sp. FY34]